MSLCGCCVGYQGAPRAPRRATCTALASGLKRRMPRPEGSGRHSAESGSKNFQTRDLLVTDRMHVRCAIPVASALGRQRSLL
eukprot:4337349-Pyramimonas_sp.AAC.1